ncbi:MAG: universal stress protein [Candidatus Eremiobacteraeota bacterium]|nr:universal stress protein [Candidatus Eremiobacteraeota bacterium]
MLERVLVALDGSPTADEALEFAITVSRSYGSELILCSAIDRAAAIAAACAPDGVFPSAELVLEEYENAATSLLTEAASRAAAAGVRAKTALLDGRAAAAIVACAKERDARAIVIGTRGKRGLEHLMLGSTAEGVLRLSDVPVFVVRGAAPEAPQPKASTFGRILVAVDDSDASSAAQTLALDLAVAARSRVSFCHIVETDDLLGTTETFGYDPRPYFEERHRYASTLTAASTQAATERGVDADTVVIEGSAANGILEAAVARDADLIAVGTHGRRGFRRLLLGSVAEDLLRRSSVPVVVVRIDT